LFIPASHELHRLEQCAWGSPLAGTRSSNPSIASYCNAHVGRPMVEFFKSPFMVQTHEYLLSIHFLSEDNSIGIFHTLKSLLIATVLSSLIDLVHPYIVVATYSSLVTLVVSIEYVQTISINVGQAFL